MCPVPAKSDVFGSIYGQLKCGCPTIVFLNLPCNGGTWGRLDYACVSKCPWTSIGTFSGHMCNSIVPWKVTQPVAFTTSQSISPSRTTPLTPGIQGELLTKWLMLSENEHPSPQATSCQNDIEEGRYTAVFSQVQQYTVHEGQS